ncbi:CHAT domain-containing protein [Streptomyces canarius]
MGHRGGARPGRARRTAALCGPLDWPRLWSCAAGVIATLPLHAAGYRDPDDVEPGHAAETVMDRAVSSYTATLRALLRAHDRRPARRTEDC